MNKIIDHFVNTDGYGGNDPTSVPYQSHAAKRKALAEIIDFDGHIVPRDWLQLFGEVGNFGDIGRKIDSNAIWLDGPAFNSLNEYYKQHGMDYRIFVGTLNYGATGEGETYQVIATRAYCLGSFIAGLDVDPYFVHGMTFYEGVPDKGKDFVFDYLITSNVRRMMKMNGHIDINVKTHVNMS